MGHSIPVIVRSCFLHIFFYLVYILFSIYSRITTRLLYIGFYYGRFKVWQINISSELQRNQQYTMDTISTSVLFRHQSYMTCIPKISLKTPMSWQQLFFETQWKKNRGRARSSHRKSGHCTYRQVRTLPQFTGSPSA